MINSLGSLIASGTKLWLDSVDPYLVLSNRAFGATGATSNPIIISNLISTGRFDEQITTLLTETNLEDAAIAWKITDQVVTAAQAEFGDIWKSTAGNDGYVSFELDPLLEDDTNGLSLAERTSRYIALGKKWSEGHLNRMIKVPATEAGIASLEELAAAGIPLNVTLIFTLRQYHLAAAAVWRGAQRRQSLDSFKSVYSIFVSRVDVYTEQKYPELSDAAQGQLGIVNAKQIWQANQNFWSDKPTPLQQEIVFASTGTKKPEDPAEKYVAALAGSDIQTNPPGTNDTIQEKSLLFTQQVCLLPAEKIVTELDKTVSIEALEETLMAEGVKKFVDPQRALLALIAEKRLSLVQN